MILMHTQIQDTVFHNNEYTNIIISKLDKTSEECKENLKHIHFTLPSLHNTSVLEKNKVTNTTPYDIYSSEQTLPRHMQTKLAQLRANKSPLLQSYLHTVNHQTCMPQCPPFFSHTDGTNHLFNCSQVPTKHHWCVKKAYRSSRDNQRVGV